MKNVAKSSELLILILGITGFIVFLFFYPTIFITSAIDINHEKSALITIAKESLQRLGYVPSDYNARVKFEAHNKLLEYLNQKYSIEEQKEHFDALQPYYWRIIFTPVSEPDDSSETKSDPPWINQIDILFDQNGDEIGFLTKADDDSTIHNITPERARHLADSTLIARMQADTAKFSFSRFKQIPRDYRIDYTVEYLRSEPVLDIPVKLNIDVIGDRVGNYEYEFDVPDSRVSELSRIIAIVPFFLAIVAVGIMFIVMSIKKLRADGLGLRYVSPIAISMGLASALWLLLEASSSGVDMINTIIGMFFLGIISSIAVFIGVACSDSMTREIWDTKLITLDALRNGYIQHRLFSLSVLRGFAYAGILLGLIVFFSKIASLFQWSDIADVATDLSLVNTWSSFLTVLVGGYTSTIWLQYILTLFLVSFLAKYIGYRMWIICLVGLLWGVLNSTDFYYPTQHYYLNFLQYFIFGSLFAVILLKYDFFTLFVAFFTFYLLKRVVMLYHFDHRIYILNAAFLSLIPLALLVLAIVYYKNKIDHNELKVFTPVYVNKIVERERLQRELEIARRVQLSFLPREKPDIAGLDSASICIPALDVGGDYFDFIKLDSQRLGVAIGDVSGKGISAAFYMTLTKGFLRSITRTILSPKQVLMEINKLFYENVERRHFISMIYGIIDLENRQFTFARAGHNPVLTHQPKSGKTARLCPNGIALGLEKGEMFDQIIQEQRIPIRTGDLLAFYTDGFTEAMNSANEEFGEARLETLLSYSNNEDAEMLLQTIRNRVKAFTGNTIQHDDMTMVILKIVS